MDETDYAVLTLVVIVGAAWLIWGGAATIKAVLSLGGVLTVFGVFRVLMRR